jgi:hypothetical protein
VRWEDLKLRRVERTRDLEVRQARIRESSGLIEKYYISD